MFPVTMRLSMFTCLDLLLCVGECFPPQMKVHAGKQRGMEGCTLSFTQSEAGGWVGHDRGSDSGGHIDQGSLAVDVFNCLKHASGEESQQRIAPLYVLEVEEHGCGAAAVERQAHDALVLGNASSVEGHGQ